MFEHLASCVARISGGAAIGTGFFVAPGQLLTCAHVIAAAKECNAAILIEYAGTTYDARVMKYLPPPFPDLALLNADVPDHPTVFLESALSPGANLYIFGFTEKYRGGEPATVEYEGQALLDADSALMKFKGGQIVPGLSGAPLLNLGNWTVAGVVKSTRDRGSDLGGGGISSKTILEQLPELIALQRTIHNWDKRWINATQKQLERAAAGEPIPARSVEVLQKKVAARSAEEEIDPVRLPTQTMLESLWCPQSLVWFAEGRIALGSRDSVLRIGSTDGRIIDQFAVPESYPSYISVHSGRYLAAVCYTKLFLVDLQSRDSRSATLDAAASTYAIGWSPDGRYLAAGGTNVLQVFDRHLTLISSHHVGGKGSARGVAWTPDGLLHVGLANGQVWRLAEPFKEVEVAFQRDASVNALESSRVDDRFAVLWDDGQIEIRRGAEIVASIGTPGADAFHGGGPKIAWCLDERVIACVNGVSSSVVFWTIGAAAFARRRMDRRVLSLALDPSGSRLALGIDEAKREDGRVETLEVSTIARVVDGPSGQAAPEPHLFEADWTALIDSVTPIEGKLAPFTVTLDIQYLSSKFDWYERAVRKADANARIKRDLTTKLDRARQSALKFVDELRWAVGKMQEAHFNEREISDVCDGFAGVAIGAILGRLGIEGHPAIESLKEFIGYVFGYREDDLVYLGFDTSDGRGHTAEVPMDFLLEVNKLLDLGATLGEKHGATTSQQRIYAACQLFSDFDYAFNYYEKKQLWIRYVLPQVLERYPHDDIIISPSDVVRFGLA
jgi:WD40 repeat protein